MRGIASEQTRDDGSGTPIEGSTEGGGQPREREGRNREPDGQTLKIRKGNGISRGRKVGSVVVVEVVKSGQRDRDSISVSFVHRSLGVQGPFWVF